MKKIFSCIMIVILSSLRCFTVVANANEEIFYQNSLGLTLTEREYNQIVNYISHDELDLFTEEEIAYIMNDPLNCILDAEEVYIKTTYEIIDGNMDVLNEEYITEEAMLDAINVRNIEGASTYFYEGTFRKDYVETNMKSLFMHMYSVDATVKKVTLVCTWLDIPNCKSFDVVAFRPGETSFSCDINPTDNTFGVQTYDGQKIEYSHSNGNIKYADNGVGLSTNIVDSVSSSLIIQFSATFATGAPTLTVYGTYQHAVNNVTLAQSQNYAISFLGMGGVLNFDSSVYSKYDDTPGLLVTGSTDTSYQ